MITRDVHYLESGEDKTQRLGRSVKLQSRARCGYGAWPKNYPEEFTTSKKKVTCIVCLGYLDLEASP